MERKRNIPFFNYSALFADQEEEIMEVLRDVLRRGAFILQKDLQKFEEHLADFLHAKYAFGVSDGTNALILALRAVGVDPGDEVILPSHTYVASAAAVHFVGATPVLVECGRNHLIDADAVRAVVSDKTKVIMPVQLNGRTADMDALQEIAEDFGLGIVEDAAQALGSKFKDRCAGTFGAVGTFSFYPAKILGCFGDGGAVVTNDDNIAERIALLRDHGRNVEGEVVAWGTNCRLDNIQAAVLDFKLKTFDKDISRRRKVARQYQLGLSDISELVLPPGPDGSTDHFDVYQNYEIEAEQRDQLLEFLDKRGIKTIIQWGGKAIHQWKGLGFEGIQLPFTERIFSRCMLLPMNTTLSDEDVAYVIDNIREFYGRKRCQA